MPGKMSENHVRTRNLSQFGLVQGDFLCLLHDKNRTRHWHLLPWGVKSENVGCRDGLFSRFLSKQELPPRLWKTARSWSVSFGDGFELCTSCERVWQWLCCLCVHFHGPRPPCDNFRTPLGAYPRPPTPTPTHNTTTQPTTPQHHWPRHDCRPLSWRQCCRLCCVFGKSPSLSCDWWREVDVCPIREAVPSPRLKPENTSVAPEKVRVNRVRKRSVSDSQHVWGVCIGFSFLFLVLGEKLKPQRLFAGPDVSRARGNSHWVQCCFWCARSYTKHIRGKSLLFSCKRRI